ncbi:MAG TPA: hypothetical protein VH583_11815 [Vicinamibacterales bacterium]|jgi:hypothetical protein
MARKHAPKGFFREHALSIVVSAILLFLLVSYRGADPSTHIGAFYGNAIADWLGTLTFIIATKYFYEIGSEESRRPNPRIHARIGRFIVKHSLTIVLALTGLIWTYAYAHSDANGKAGQVLGNIVSEWTQLIGLVVITKYVRERGSKA